MRARTMRTWAAAAILAAASISTACGGGTGGAGGTGAGGGTGGAPLAACDRPATSPEVIGSLTSVMSLAVVGPLVYAANYGSGDVAAFPACGGDAEVVDAAGAGVVAVVGDHVYWSALGTGAALLKTRPVAGGAVSTVAELPAVEIRGLAGDGEKLYVTTVDGSSDDTRVQSVSLVGGAVVTLASDTAGPKFHHLVVRGGVVYFTAGDYFAQEASLRSVPAAGGAVSTLVSLSGLLTGLAADTTTLYYTSKGELGSPGAVWKLPLGGGTPTSLAESDREPNGIAVDDSHVYWGERYGRVRRTSIAGGLSYPISTVDGADAVAVDANNVFWADTSGYLLRRSK